jgi:hypothetical protein
VWSWAGRLGSVELGVKKHSHRVLIATLLHLAANNSPGEAQSASRGAEARRALAQIELARKNLSEDCGGDVIAQNRGDVFCAKYGRTSIGDAWNKHLDAVGFPSSFDEREALAKILNLPSGESLVLVSGAADDQKLQHLVRALRHIIGP